MKKKFFNIMKVLCIFTFLFISFGCENSVESHDGSDSANSKNEFTVKLTSSYIISEMSFIAEKGSEVKLPKLEYPNGYIFYGWKDKSGNMFKNSFIVTKDVELSAIWLAHSGFYKEMYISGLDHQASNYYSKQNPLWGESGSQEYPLKGDDIVDLFLNNTPENVDSYEIDDNKVYLVTKDGYFFNSDLMRAEKQSVSVERKICDFENERTFYQVEDGCYVFERISKVLPSENYILDEETKEYLYEVE